MKLRLLVTKLLLFYKISISIINYSQGTRTRRLFTFILFSHPPPPDCHRYQRYDNHHYISIYIPITPKPIERPNIKGILEVDEEVWAVVEEDELDEGFGCTLFGWLLTTVADTTLQPFIPLEIRLCWSEFAVWLASFSWLLSTPMFIMMDPIMSDVTPTALEHEELLTKLLDNIWQNEFSNIFTFLMTLANLI